MSDPYAQPPYDPYGQQPPQYGQQPPPYGQQPPQYGQQPQQPPQYGQQPPQYGQQPPQYGNDPAYGQPSYGQEPGYGQPAYDPGYGAPTSGPGYGPPTSGPAYGQPAYGPPQPDYGPPGGGGGWGGPAPAPPPKKRTGLIVTLVIVGIVVLLCGGIGFAAYRFSSNDTPTTSPTAAGGSTKTTGPAATSTKGGGGTNNGPKVTLTAPATISTWKKASNQDQAKTMSDQMASSGIKNPFAAQYQDTSKTSRTAVVWGGTGSIFSVGSPQTQLDAFFKSALTGLGSASGSPVNVDAGKLGGKAQCQKTDGTSGVTLAVCAWVGNEALVAFMFNSIEADAAATQVKVMLPAIAIAS